MALHIKAITRVEKSLNSTSKDIGVSLPTLSILKHWGVILHIYEGNQRRDPKLIEAFQENGKLVCKMRSYIGEKVTEWETAHGYEETKLKMNGQKPNYDEDVIQNWLEDFNRQKKEYNFIFQNCQEFVDTLLRYLDVKVTDLTAGDSCVAASMGILGILGFLVKK